MRPADAVILIVVLLCACEREPVPEQLRVLGGEPELGRELIAEYGCYACHQIPGLTGFTGTVGPTLEGFGRRSYIAGRLPNRPMMLTWWLRDPPAIDPETAMPAIGVSEAEARHIAAYLYTLR